MAGKRKKTTTVVEEIPQDLETEETQGPTDLDFSLEEVRNAEQLQAVIEQFPDAGIIAKLYDAQGAFCYRFADARNIDEEDVRKRCGPGEFVVRIYINSKYRQSIPLPIRALLPLDRQPGDGSSSSSLNDRHSEFLEKLLLAFISKENPVAASAPAPTVTELIAGIAQLDTLRGKQESAMDLFQKGIEFAQSASGQADWKSDALRTVRDIAPQVLGAINGIRGNGNGNGVMPNTEPVGELPPDAIIKSGIAYLKKKAIAGVDPELIIEWIANNAEEYEPLLRVVLNSEFSTFVEFDPEIGREPFVSWFKPLFDGLRSAFKPPDSVDDNSGGNVGNPSDTGSNGKFSPTGGTKPKG